MSVLTMMKPAISGADLPYEDGIPLESDWHLDAINLLLDILGHFWQDRSDVYIGGNMFVYFDPNQRKNHDFCGPDFFVVKGAAGKHRRDSWVVWEENRRAPNFVVELASPSTAEFDLDGKKDIYEQKLKTPEYVIYDPAAKTLSGWRLLGGRYVAIPLDAKGRLWSRELGLWLGIAEYSVPRRASKAKFLRFFDRDGSLLPTEKEAEAQRAEAEAQRAKAAEEQLEVEKQEKEAEAQRAKAAEEQLEAEKQEKEAEAQRAKVAEERHDVEKRRADAAEAEIARLRALWEK